MDIVGEGSQDNYDVAMNEPNLFGISDIDEMCSEALGLVGEVDSLFQPDVVQQQQQHPLKYIDHNDYNHLAYDISSISYNDVNTDSEEKLASEAYRRDAVEIDDRMDREFEPDEASEDSSSDEEERYDNRSKKRMR